MAIPSILDDLSLLQESLLNHDRDPPKCAAMLVDIPTVLARSMGERAGTGFASSLQIQDTVRYRPSRHNGTAAPDRHA